MSSWIRQSYILVERSPRVGPDTSCRGDWDRKLSGCIEGNCEV